MGSQGVAMLPFASGDVFFFFLFQGSGKSLSNVTTGNCEGSFFVQGSLIFKAVLQLRQFYCAKGSFVFQKPALR